MKNELLTCNTYHHWGNYGLFPILVLFSQLIMTRLSVTTINKPVLSDSSGEALFAVFDGGRNETIANLLCDVVPTTLKEERAKSKDPETYLKYCLLSAHR